MDSPSESQEEEKKETTMFYDQVDIRNAYSSGFWIGAVSGVVSALVVCLLVGLFYYS